jgi:hypothetical protein
MATYNNIKKIKIGDNVFNLYDSGNSGGTITSVKTTAGAHTTVNVTSGAVSFNVPTTAAHVGAVPTTRKVNNKALSSDITLTAPDVGAAEVQKLTQAEYDALTTISDDTIYFITDGSASTRNPYLDMNYPIGSYYETSDANFDPNTVWGGTWVLTDGGVMNGNPQTYCLQNYTQSSAITTTSTRTVMSENFTTQTGRFQVRVRCALQTSRYTSNVAIYVNNTAYAHSTTNQTQMHYLSTDYIYNGTKGATYTVAMVIRSQDSGTTATIPVYTTYALEIIDIPRVDGYCWHRTA